MQYFKFSIVALVVFMFFSSPASAELKPWKTNLKDNVNEITVQELAKAMKQGKINLIDVREPGEFDAGHIAGAVNVPRGYVDFKMPRMYKNADAKLYIYCKSGARGLLASQTLQRLGYTNIKHVKKGFYAWTKAGFPYYNYHGESKITAFGKKEK